MYVVLKNSMLGRAASNSGAGLKLSSGPWLGTGAWLITIDGRDDYVCTATAT